MSLIPWKELEPRPQEEVDSMEIYCARCGCHVEKCDCDH